MADLENETTQDENENGGEKYANPQWRHWFMFVLSAIVVGIVLYVSYNYGRSLFKDSNAERQPILYLIPYATNLAGVLIFIMNTSRKKRGDWSFREYWGDHFFRIAQSFVYLFIIMWAYNAAAADKVDAVATAFSPNILGFLVGLFILRVERAMEGLGDKFEEALTAILPRATQYVSAEERRRQQLKMVYKVDDIATQYDVLRSQLDDRAARDRFDQVLDEAQGAVGGEDPEKTKAAINKLIREFDDVKKSAGEVLVPIEDLLLESKKK